MITKVDWTKNNFSYSCLNSASRCFFVAVSVFGVAAIVFGGLGLSVQFGLLHLSFYSLVGLGGSALALGCGGLVFGLSLIYIIPEVKRYCEYLFLHKKLKKLLLNSYPPLSINKTQKSNETPSSALEILGLTQDDLDRCKEHQGKIYYETDNNDISYIKIDKKADTYSINGHLVKSRKSFASGVSKRACYLYDSKEDKIYVKTVETIANPACAKIENEILEELKDSPYILTLVEKKEKTVASGTKETRILEYCNENTLKDHPEFDAYQKLVILKDCLLGLAALHEKGKLHFDLHEGNFFVHNGRGKLGDFGNARSITYVQVPANFSDMYNHQEWTACRHLLPPELLMHIYQILLGDNNINKNITEKLDVWSFGVTMAISLYDIDFNQLDDQEYCKSFPPYLAFLHNYKRNLKLENLEFLDAYIPRFLYVSPPPTDQGSLDYLLWQMTHPDYTQRPTAKEAAARIESILSTAP